MNKTFLPQPDLKNLHHEHLHLILHTLCPAIHSKTNCTWSFLINAPTFALCLKYRIWRDFQLFLDEPEIILVFIYGSPVCIQNAAGHDFKNGITPFLLRNATKWCSESKMRLVSYYFRISLSPLKNYASVEKTVSRLQN